jgi:hypothetical protein
MAMATDLTLDGLKDAAREFALATGQTGIAPLYGVTDGKAVGTYVEATFNVAIQRLFDYTPGNAARGIDFPELDVDLKVTSIRQPQSSCPFRDATQKVYGLGYHLLVMVYEKADDDANREARLNFLHVIFIDREFTGDYQTTLGLRAILNRDGNADDVDAFLEERMLPLDEIGRRQLAERVVIEPPAQGYLTVSNALQWRLQYGRAILVAPDPEVPGLEELLA